MVYTYRLSYERRGDIVSPAIKLILPSLECDNLFIDHILVPLSRAKTRLYFQIIYTSSTFQNGFKIIAYNTLNR